MRYQTPTKKGGNAVLSLPRLKLQFTIYNITTNISVEESWKCTVWPKVFFFFFVFSYLLPKRMGVMSIFKLTFTLLRFYKCTILQSKGFMSTNCRIHLYFKHQKS